MLPKYPTVPISLIIFCGKSSENGVFEMLWAPGHRQMMWEDRLSGEQAGMQKRQVRPHSKARWPVPGVHHGTLEKRHKCDFGGHCSHRGSQGTHTSLYQAALPLRHSCPSLLHANKAPCASFCLHVPLLTSTQRVLPHSLLRKHSSCWSFLRLYSRYHSPLMACFGFCNYLFMCLPPLSQELSGGLLSYSSL